MDTALNTRLDERRAQIEVHQTKHLILLIGGNPLPNLLAAHLLLAPDGRITMIYSPQRAEGETGESSYDTANRLKSLLARSHRADGSTLVVDETHITLKDAQEWNPYAINDAVRSVIKTDESTGLHYTGGTKAMSVHAYRAVSESGLDKVQFTYLDAPHHMVIEKGDAQPERIRCDLLVDVKFDDLMELHGFQCKPGAEGVLESVLGKTALAIAAANAQSGTRKQWDEWLFQLRKNPDANSAVDEKGVVKGVRWKNVNSEQLQIPWPPRACGMEHQIKSELSDLASADTLDVGVAAQKLGLRGREFLEWLSSFWLESAVQAALEKNQAKYKLRDIRRNVEPTVVTTPFELDVVAMRGHQLFTFSCGTAGSSSKKSKDEDSRGELKLKLFEVKMRAEQLGGAHACAALVCRRDDPADLEAEVRATMSHGGRVKVFGSRDLENLPKAIGKWIEEQSR